MSIVPINDRRGAISNPSSLEFWDPEGFFSFDLWDPFPAIFSTNFPSFGREIFPSLETHVDWKENSRAHVFRAVFPGLSGEDVFVYVDDDNMLEISTESGKFMSKFKLPENAKRDEIKASMVNGALTVTVPKEGARTPNVRAIEISGSD